MWWEKLIELFVRLANRWLDRKSKVPTKTEKINEAGVIAATKEENEANRITEEARIKMKIPVIVILLGCVLLSGCTNTRAKPSPIMVIESDRTVYPMTSTNGVSGWFIPDATMKVYLQACQRVIDCTCK